MAESDTGQKSSGPGRWQSNTWAWPVGLMLGLVIGLAALDGAAGVAIGIAMGVAFAVALGAGSTQDDDSEDEDSADSEDDDSKDAVSDPGSEDGDGRNAHEQGAERQRVSPEGAGTPDTDGQGADRSRTDEPS
ncbi:hypothetical protein AB0J85_15725 [Micromonospora echinofusca]|uniref:hypothetical protein n=1 Tax=Micromonospora echinofusca TaxID=47858 RepID=UPI0034398C06